MFHLMSVCQFCNILTGDVSNESEGDQDLHHSSVNDCDHPAHPHHPPAHTALSSSSHLSHTHILYMRFKPDAFK